MREMKALTISVLIVMFIFTTANAGKSSDSGKWDFNLASFYLWAVSMDGDLKVMENGVPLV